jgi:hypothetical protein
LLSSTAEEHDHAYSRYDVVFNLRTARELGINISPETIKGSKVIK